MIALTVAQIVAVVTLGVHISLQNPQPHDGRWNSSESSSDEVTYHQQNVSVRNSTLGELSLDDRRNASLFAIDKMSSNDSFETSSPTNDDRYSGKTLPESNLMSEQNYRIQQINPASKGSFSWSGPNNGSLPHLNAPINGSHEVKSKRDPFGTGAAALNGCPKLAAGLLSHGCWCGEGHRCEAIQDNVDMCCHNHDQCYGLLPDQQAYCDSMFSGCMQKLNECH